MTARRIALVSFLALSFFAAHRASAAAATRPKFDLAAVTNAHYRARHLIGNGIVSGPRRDEIESNLRILEAIELTQSLASTYRQSITRIEEGLQYYEQAKGSAGKQRSQYVEWGNRAMRAAKALLDLAIRIFEEVQPQLVRFFAAAQQPSRRGQDDEPKPWPIVINPAPFRDCLAGPKGSDPGCCEQNHRAALSLIEQYAAYFTEDEIREIEENCLKPVREQCEGIFKRGRGTDFSKRFWEECFHGYFIFKYGNNPQRPRR
jgi:hypothetical protein